MEIPMNVDVICGRKTCGKSTQVLVNPINEQVTHVVVAAEDFPNTEKMVPVEYITKTSPDWIKLNCTAKQFEKMEPFMETDFIQSGNVEFMLPLSEPYMVWPYTMYEAVPISLEKKHIPAGEVAIHRGTPVYATDGRIGKVDEFLVRPDTDNISHLVLREGHLWGQKDVSVSVDEIEKIKEDGVHLSINKKAVEGLPPIETKRKWK